MTQRIFAIDEPPALSVQPEVIESDSIESDNDEFELVMGRRQAIAISFLVLVLVAVFSAGSYLAGKATSARVNVDPPEIKLEQAPPSDAAAPVFPAPTLEATLISPMKSADAPIFGNPAPQAIYIQVGAVEKGVAVVLAEGLRKHGLDSFVTSGPGTRSFRVLIGPFPDAEAYQKARNIVAEIGLDSFARRYQPQ